MVVVEAQSALERTLAPRSVAVIGASRTPDKLGGKVLANLEARFSGTLYAVNRHLERGAGTGSTTWLSDLSELPDGVDLVVLALPYTAVGALIGAGPLAKDLGGIAVLAEPAGDPAERRGFEQRLAAYAAGTGTRVLGPNTSGFRAYQDGIFATFAGDVDASITRHATGYPAAPVSLVSQSGAMMAYLGGTLLRGRNVGLDYVVDTGNETDIGAADCLAFLTDRGARRLGLVLEGTRDWQALREQLARSVARGVRVVALQVGRSSAGQAISASHTGAVGGAAGAFRTVMEAAGALVAEDERAFLDELTVDPAMLAGARPEVFLGSFSGGMNALIVDELADRGFAVPAVVASPAGAPGNPADFGPAALRDTGPIREFLRRAGDFPALAGTIIFTGHVTQMDRVGAEVFSAICQEGQKLPHPVIVVGKAPAESIAVAPANVLVVDDPTSAVHGLAGALHVDRSGPPAPLAEAQSHNAAEPPGGGHDAVPATAASWPAAQRMLRRAGVTVPETQVALSPEAAAAAARDIGFPVVLKADAPTLFHRARNGLVRLDLADSGAVGKAFTELMARCAELGLDGATVLVQRMIPHDIELFVGVRLEDAYGPTVILSHGGGDVEAAGRTRLQLPVPLEADRCRAALDRLGIAPHPALVANLVAICRIATDLPDTSVLEVNPLCVSAGFPAGVAVDCLILQTVPAP